MGIAVRLIKAYRAVWHPLYRGCVDRGVVLSRCRLRPTCSEFALRVFERYHFFKAFSLIWSRLRKCHNQP